MRKISNFGEFANQVEYFVSTAKDYKADYVLFPELLTQHLLSFIKAKDPQVAIRRVASYTRDYVQTFKRLAKEYKLLIIGGSHPTPVDGGPMHHICLRPLANITDKIRCILLLTSGFGGGLKEVIPSISLIRERQRSPYRSVMILNFLKLPG